MNCAGIQVAFDGAPRTINVESYQLPVTCLVVMGGARGVFQIFGSGTVSCELSGTSVQCDKARVP